MNAKKEFERIMAEQAEIALATSVDDISNVRIVNFVYDEVLKTLYFASFRDNDKIKEFSQNKNVSFTTIPHKGNEHVKAKAQVNESQLSVFDVQDRFVSKIPNYKNTIEQAGQYLVLYELKFDTATVTLDFENIEVISLT
ncbi:pyridoxamine 5'-phosphate oxidase family protein [Fusibacter ferrireducens]|uniref:Pyridoxamine 5'-phosphate oxidase family protein n=1 Tax=Fusibacter ferrireducens TaxID=2785058 RepID=A0ABR9ZNZ0_9FIRM|nr:pyridoxamine 5'-phosphate oxidase family protein [Fusibacter ferrireducens]MBF4692177.1 pyridoxamine 5'-phosphate oxidase family protein [Fusibacter ferrireducens]